MFGFVCMEDLVNNLDEHVKGSYIIHYFGAPYEQEIVDELKRIRSERNISIAEDSTQTLLSGDTFYNYMVRRNPVGTTIGVLMSRARMNANIYGYMWCSDKSIP